MAKRNRTKPRKPGRHRGPTRKDRHIERIKQQPCVDRVANMLDGEPSRNELERRDPDLHNPFNP